MATHSSILAWKIPWTEEPGGQPSMELHRVGTGLSDLHKNNAFLFYLSVPEGRGFIDSEPYSLSSSTIGPRPEEGNQSTYLGGEMKNEKEMNV